MELGCRDLDSGNSVGTKKPLQQDDANDPPALKAMRPADPTWRWLGGIGEERAVIMALNTNNEPPARRRRSKRVGRG